MTQSLVKQLHCKSCKMQSLKFCGLFIVYLYQISFVTSTPTSLELSSHNNRTSKFFLGWGVGLVRFENGICTNGDGYQGICYTRRQCNEVGGVGYGSCASGIGVCCTVSATCGQSTSSNNTYFTNADYPSSTSGVSTTTCTLTVHRCNADICQLRIDLLAFDLAPPNDTGVCVDDAFYVVGGAESPPVLCGQNGGQHLYVDFNDGQDIQLVVRSNGNGARRWNMKVAQIGCGCPTRAPTGCLQYYTALSGTVNSFNYGTDVTPTGTRQLVNSNYGVCVEMAPGYCSIQWSQGPDPTSFTVTGNTFVATGGGTVGTAAEAVNGADCMTDFVVIPDPTYVDPALAPSNTDRFCGNAFIPVVSSSKPFVMTVVDDGDEGMDLGNRGFSLNYQQLPCTGTLIGQMGF